MDLADTVTAWFDRNARDLPWRHASAGPWGVLVSEVMLQQTPVSRVLPVWREWLDRWPDPAVAGRRARPPRPIRAWGRLGYPRRALRLHACAVAIVERYGGVVPSRLTDLLALPGIGAYTARAVAAFAYGQRQPVVDTNVRRLVARAVDGRADAGPATTAADLAAVDALLPADDAAGGPGQRRLHGARARWSAPPAVAALRRLSTVDVLRLAAGRQPAGRRAVAPAAGVRGYRPAGARAAARRAARGARTGTRRAASTSSGRTPPSAPGRWTGWSPTGSSSPGRRGRATYALAGESVRVP